jgi:hypothetical protein
MGKILKRCSICKRLGAAYLVNDPKLGKLLLCYSCWKKRQEEEGNAPKK